MKLRARCGLQFKPCQDIKLIGECKQVACGYWQDWTLSEMLVRWLSGNLAYEIFKAVEPGMKLVEAFEKLEYDLLPPSLGLVLHVSAQVAAGWYSRPTESPFWVARPSRSSLDDPDYTSDGSSAGVENFNNTYREPRDDSEGMEDDSYNGLEAYSLGQRGSAEMSDSSDSGEGYEIDGYFAMEEQSGGEDYGFEDKLALARETKKPMKRVPLVYGRKTGRSIMATEYIE